MLYDVEGTRSVFGRSLAAEIRARLAVRRMSGKTLAAMIGVSQNYLAKRLRDEAPLTVDDLAAIAEVLGADDGPDSFAHDALERHGEAARRAFATAGASEVVPIDADRAGSASTAESVYPRVRRTRVDAAQNEDRERRIRAYLDAGLVAADDLPEGTTIEQEQEETQRST